MSKPVKPTSYRELLNTPIPDMTTCRVLVSAFQASVFLRRSPNWCKLHAKELGGKLIGNQWLFWPPDLVEFATGRKVA